MNQDKGLFFAEDNGEACADPSSDFLGVLRDFKRTCVGVNNVFQGYENELEKGDQGDQACPVCSSHAFIASKNGYWIECTDANCPKMRGLSTLTNRMLHLHSFRDLRASGKIRTNIPREEIYENYFYGSKHWNYCARESDIGPVILTIKQEFPQTRGLLRIMVRSSSHIIHGMLPVARICPASPYSHEEVVQFLSHEIGLNAPLRPVTISTAPAELLKMDKVFLKDEHKIGILYMKEDQETEEQLFENQKHSQAFDDFLDSLGQRVRLRGFNKYRGGLDNAGDLTGTHSVHTTFRNKQIMFHVSTLLPFEKNDSQKLQRKRHIGNDIVCVVFLEASHTKFNPSCIKSNFLHTFIVVQVNVAKDPNTYTVSVVSRSRVPLYDPHLVDKHIFEKGPEFRDWILTKVINGETACHRAPEFAKLHQRTRHLLMDDLIKCLERNGDVSQEKREPQPFRDPGRWLQTGPRPSSPYQDSVQQKIDTADQLPITTTCSKEDKLADVAFLVGRTDKKRFVGVRSVMAARSSVFHKLFLEEPASSESLPSLLQDGTNSPVTGRKSSWTISGSLLQGGSRSRKFTLNKVRRSQSASEVDQNDVVLSSVTDLEKSGRDSLALREHVIEEFEADEFEALLSYLHTGTCHITARILPGLLCAADYYNVPEVSQVCMDSIEECLHDTTVFSALKSLDDYSGYSVSRQLWNKIGTFLEQSDMSELNMNEFSMLSEESAKLVLSSVKKVSEVSKFQATVDWAKYFSKKTDCHASIEEVAKPLIAQYVNINNISPEDLMEVVYPSGLVPSDHIMEAMALKSEPSHVSK